MVTDSLLPPCAGKSAAAIILTKLENLVFAFHKEGYLSMPYQCGEMILLRSFVTIHHAIGNPTGLTHLSKYSGSADLEDDR